MASLHTYTVLIALTLVGACAQPGVKPGAAQASPAAAGVETPETDETLAANLPAQPLTPDLLFRFLVAEVAGQRGAIGIAQSTYLELARQTQDPRVARRAAEVSMFARNQAGALEATRLWAGTEPASTRAQQTLAALLLGEGKLDEAEPLLKKLLQQNPANGFLHLGALMGKVRDAQATLGMVERLAADHPTLPEARFAVAQAAAGADRMETAIAALQQADTLRPGWEPAALLRAQILTKTSRTEALSFMRDFLARHPDAREVRLGYARTLVADSQFVEARNEFNRLVVAFPRNAEISMAAGLLALQLGDSGAARGLLTQTLDYTPNDPDTVHYYLGQIDEQAKQTDAAIAHYTQVTAGNYLLPARARQAGLLARAGKLDEARALLGATVGENDAQKVRLIQMQAELLRDGKQVPEAYATLTEGLKRYPDSSELLYDRAMVAERLDKLDVLETDLRRVIVLRPDDAQAYNALGYTLADRTDRLAEAMVLLDKALSLSPEDPFILDSVGWAQYRSGNLARAQEMLERAYKVRPDPEIAAHLGEVLWARGQRDEAGNLWQTSLQTHPQNEVLLETLRRLKP